MEDDEEYNAESCKVVLLGESGVGKTSIISQFLNQEFSEDQPSTTGATFASKTLDIEKYNKTICFEIWDTAGQEKFKSLAKMFYKDASIVVFVYDITRRESFEEIENYWVEQVRENAPKKIIMVIAANKTDLYEQEAVEEDKGRKLAKELGALFKYTSAKNRVGIEELFIEAGNCFCDPNYMYSEEALEEAERMKKVKEGTAKIEKDKEEEEGGSEQENKVNKNKNKSVEGNQAEKEKIQINKKKNKIKEKKCC